MSPCSLFHPYFLCFEWKLLSRRETSEVPIIIKSFRPGFPYYLFSIPGRLVKQRAHCFISEPNRVPYLVRADWWTKKTVAHEDK